MLHPFGFGLSYTSFAYRDLVVPGKIVAGEILPVRLTVVNTGVLSRETVVELYVSAVNPPTRSPIRQLAAVKRLALAPGESVQTELAIGPESFLLTFDDGSRKLLPGLWKVEASFDSMTPAAEAEVRLE